MEKPLIDWPRPLYQNGSLKPFLFYVVFGTVASDLNVSRSRHQCASIPASLSLSSFGPGSNPEVLDQFREGFLWDRFCEQSPGSARQTSAQLTCVVLRGDIEDDSTLDYLRDTIGLITAMLEAGGVAVYDPQRFEWWSAQAWQTEVFGAAPAATGQHAVILESREPNGNVWYHTRGMRKFGRPDLSMHDVPQTEHTHVVDMFNRFIRMHADGAIVPEGRRIVLAGLPDNLYCHHRGSLDDPDFNNVHIEISTNPSN